MNRNYDIHPAACLVDKKRVSSRFNPVNRVVDTKIPAASTGPADTLNSTVKVSVVGTMASDFTMSHSITPSLANGCS